MRLLVVELEGDGHNMVLYTRLLLQGCRRRGWSATLLTTRSGRQHPAFELLSNASGQPPAALVIPDIDRADSTGSLALMMSQFRIWWALRRSCRANDGFARFDLIYCVNIDKYEKAIALLGSPFGKRPFTAMLTNPKFHRAPLGLGPRSRWDRMYRAMFGRLLKLRSLQHLTVIDEPFRRFCETVQIPFAEKIRVVPDVGEILEHRPMEAARRNLGIPKSALVVLLYGSLSRRKGAQQLLRAVETIDDADIVALVAGKPDEEIAELLASSWCRALQRNGSLVIREGFHDEEAEAELFAAADVVWLGYVGGAYGSSGVLFQAGSAGLPVISMQQGLIGWLVREHDAGIPLDPQDALAVQEAIRRLWADQELRRRYGENGRRLAQSHTGTAFTQSVCGVLESLMAVPEAGASDPVRTAADRSPGAGES